MKKNLGGRPKLPKGQAKAAVITARMLKSEYRKAKEAAKRDGLPLSEWVRAVLIAAANADKMAIPGSEAEGIEPDAAATASPGGVKPL